MGKPGEVESQMNREVTSSARWIRAIMTVGSSVLGERDGAERALCRYIEVVSRLEAAATNASNTGFANICTLFRAALIDLRSEARGLAETECQLLNQWPDLLAFYLDAPENPATRIALAEHLAASQWKAPISRVEVEHLSAMLNPEAVAAMAVHDSLPDSPSIDDDALPAKTGDSMSWEVEIRPQLGEQHASNDQSVSDAPLMTEATPATGFDDTNIEPANQKPLPDEVLVEAMPIADETFSIITNPITNFAEPVDEAISLNEEQPSAEQQATSVAADNEFIQLLRDELTTAADSMHAWLATLATPGAEPAARVQAATDYREQIQRLALASDALRLDGLSQVLAAAQTNLPEGVGELAAISEELRDLLDGYTPLLLDYLGRLGDLQASLALVEHMQASGWPQPLDETESLTVAGLLANPVLATFEEEEQAPRQTEARADDVSLALPDDLNQELLNGLLQELPVQTATFTGAMQRIAAGTGTLHDLDDAKRAAHTLKGAANTVGVRGIANLTHHLEDVFVALSKQKAMPNSALAETLQTAGDCLEAMSEALVGISEQPADAVKVLQDVLDWANRIDREGVPATEETVAPGTSVSPMESQHEKDHQEAAASTQAATPMLRVPASVIDEVLRLAGEMIISNAQLQERLRQAKAQSLAVSKQHQVFMQLTAELENLVDIRGAATHFHKSDGKMDFDPLEFEHYNELHTITRRLIETATDARALGNEFDGSLINLNDVLEGQHRLQLESQNAVLRTRMVPVSSIFSRLQRSVRQTCRLLDKEVELQLAGADTYVDTNVLNDLVDPLMHVLRNAIDHGIEPVEVRRQRGKSITGHIELSFSREGNYVVVRCKDDGGGLDLDAIRIAAENKGMISPDGMLTADEISRLILVPGFSTRAETTQTSGRGIGMDVVQSRLVEMKGSINLLNRLGHGLTVEMRIPATLISTHGLLVHTCDSLVAVSCRGVEDIHYVTAEQIKSLGSHSTYHVNEQVYDVIKLEVLLNIPGDRRRASRSSGFPALLVRMDSGTVRAVLTQEVIDSRELVVKSLGQYVPKSKGIIGATILGDGSVAPVIDLPELLRNPERSERMALDFESATKRASGAVANAPTRIALVVDDSLSARRAAAEVMRNAGFEVCMAMDGLEAVTLLERMVPTIILVDMEMPRMNGLEFTARVRAREATKHIPVIMITSRSTVKHREEAKAAGVDTYITKPFNDENLLDEVASLCK